VVEEKALVMKEEITKEDINIKQENI